MVKQQFHNLRLLIRNSIIPVVYFSYSLAQIHKKILNMNDISYLTNCHFEGIPDGEIMSVSFKSKILKLSEDPVFWNSSKKTIRTDVSRPYKYWHLYAIWMWLTFDFSQRLNKWYLSFLYYLSPYGLIVIYYSQPVWFFL